MSINRRQQLQQRLRNTLHSVLIMSGMVVLLGYATELVFGPPGWLLVLVILSTILITLRLSPLLVMRLYQAQPLHYRLASELHQIARLLSERAGLPVIPELYYIASPVATAFTAGNQHNAAIAFSDGLFRRLDIRELSAVLAHEISHIRHRDLGVMALADSISRMTTLVASFGLLFLLILSPILFLYGQPLPLLAMLVLLVTPKLTTLLQLALSRTREFDADLGAVELTHDPDALISALQKLQPLRHSWFSRILLPENDAGDPSMLRSHPPLSDRVQRLRAIELPAQSQVVPLQNMSWDIHQRLMAVTRRPRRHWSGLWY